MTFEEWCAKHGYDPSDDDLRYRFDTFVWYTEATPSKELTNEQT